MSGRGSVRAMATKSDETMRVYHNPVCSKSRGALEILGERGVDLDVIEYLKHPELMERPVVFRGDRAVIARPSEKVLELLD
jgi:arsenate reductase-like glutaredoxin family protein